MKCVALKEFAQETHYEKWGGQVAPEEGLEPSTYWLTANRSTIELLRNTEGRKT